MALQEEKKKLEGTGEHHRRRCHRRQLVGGTAAGERFGSAAEAVATGKMWAERKIGKRRERRKALPEAPADVAPMVERDSNRLVQPTALTTARDVAHDAAGDCKNQQQNEGWLQEPQMMQRKAVPAWIACY